MAQYDPKKVNVVVAGFIALGFAEGTFINAERSVEKRSQRVGSKGDVETIKSADDTGTITITLQQSSPTNAVLKQLYNSDNKFQVAIVDTNFSGDVGVQGAECSVENLPAFSRGDETEDVEWTILADNYDGLFPS